MIRSTVFLIIQLQQMKAIKNKEIYKKKFQNLIVKLDQYQKQIRRKKSNTIESINALKMIDK